MGPLRQGRRRHRQRRRAARRRPARRGRARPPRGDHPGPRHRRGDRRRRHRSQGGAAGPLPAGQARGRGARRPADRARAPRPGPDRATRSVSHPLAARASRATVARQLVAALERRRGERRRASPRSRRWLEGRDGDIVVVLGRGDVAESADATVQRRGRARATMHRRPSSSSRCAGATSAAHWTSGSRPGSCPAGSTLEAGREWFAQAWGAVPAERGPRRRPGSSLRREPGPDPRAHAARHRPAGRLPRPHAGRGARSTRPASRSRSTRSSPTARSAPTSSSRSRCGARRSAASRTSRAGSSASAPTISPDGTAMPDWRIAAELALRLGADFDLETVDEVQDEIARGRPRARRGGRDAAAPGAATASVLPLAEHRDALVLGPVRIPVTIGVVGADRAPGRGARRRTAPRRAPASSGRRAPERPRSSSPGSPRPRCRPTTRASPRSRRRPRRPATPAGDRAGAAPLRRRALDRGHAAGATPTLSAS